MAELNLTPENASYLMSLAGLVGGAFLAWVFVHLT